MENALATGLRFQRIPRQSFSNCFQVEPLLGGNLESPHLDEFVHSYGADWVKDEYKSGHYEGVGPITFHNQIFWGQVLTRKQVSLTVESVNSYIAWEFSLAHGKMNLDIGFSVECIDLSGRKTLILPYRRYEADQGNFCTCVSGNYKLIWDNSYSAFFKKVLRYKVDCIPPVVESVSAADQ